MKTLKLMLIKHKFKRVLQWASHRYYEIFYVAVVLALLSWSGRYWTSRNDCRKSTCPVGHLPTFDSRRDPECLCVSGSIPLGNNP